MKVLAEIHRREGINLLGQAIHRIAVRGVILQEQKLLMVYSSVVGDYKFPGGGVEVGELHEQTLRREIREECGAVLVDVGEMLGVVIEYDIPVEVEYDLFKMTSYYYLCQVESNFNEQMLDTYEKELGFEPVWVNVEKAILVNRLLLNSGNSPNWLKREICILEYIKQWMKVGEG